VNKKKTTRERSRNKMRKRYYFPQNLLTDEDGKESKIETERQILYIGLVGKKMFC
jgi:hypothetical protein